MAASALYCVTMQLLKDDRAGGVMARSLLQAAGAGTARRACLQHKMLVTSTQQRSCSTGMARLHLRHGVAQNTAACLPLWRTRLWLPSERCIGLGIRAVL